MVMATARVKQPLSDAWLRRKWMDSDVWASDVGSRGAARLVAKKTAKDNTFYFRYFSSDGKKRHWPIGAWDGRGFSLLNARDKAAELSQLYRSGIVNLHEHFAAQLVAGERARRAAVEAVQAAEMAAKRSTLRQLLDAYVAHQHGKGKQSAADARRIFQSHVFDAAPAVAAKRAAEVSIDDFVELIGALIEAKKGRTAAKLRSYLRAAYSLAIKAKTDPTAPMHLRTFGITVNPLASIAAMSGFNRSRSRHLSAEELGAFLRRLDALPASSKRDAVSLCLMLGGQRPTQLLRVLPVGVDLSAETIMLFDPKGSRQQPRQHMLPLPKKAIALLKRRIESASEDAPADAPIFTNDGASQLRIETVSAFVTDISADMVTAKEAREPFQLRDVRRTCETMLAALGVSSDVRAMLLSHGLGGVQKRHYDFHDYAQEMRAALEKWARRLDRLASGEASNVVRLRTGTEKATR
jgi:hypothetical protein